jgi:hypothetical protein
MENGDANRRPPELWKEHTKEVYLPCHALSLVFLLSGIWRSPFANLVEFALEKIAFAVDTSLQAMH